MEHKINHSTFEDLVFAFFEFLKQVNWFIIGGFKIPPEARAGSEIRKNKFPGMESVTLISCLGRPSRSAGKSEKT